MYDVRTRNSSNQRDTHPFSSRDLCSLETPSNDSPFPPQCRLHYSSLEWEKCRRQAIRWFPICPSRDKNKKRFAPMPLCFWNWTQSLNGVVCFHSSARCDVSRDLCWNPDNIPKWTLWSRPFGRAKVCVGGWLYSTQLDISKLLYLASTLKYCLKEKYSSTTFWE